MKKTLIAAGVFAISAILVGGGSGYFTSKSENTSEIRSASASADHKTASNTSPPAPESAAGSQSAHPATHPATQSPPQASSLSRASQEKKAQIAERLSPAFDKPVSIEHGGALRELTLAKDELYVRNADGIGRVVSIPPAASASELLGQIAKVQKETGSAPELILYPSGTPRNDSTRRIVTRDILIEADSRSSAETLATTSGLSFKSAPIYAKGKYIYEAPSSPEALAFFAETADSTTPYVTPLLASKVAKMTMPNDPFVQKQWHLKFQNQMGAFAGTDMNVESVWNYPSTTKFSPSNATGYIRGNGVTIGIVDDGMEWSHPDLLPNVLKSLQKDWNGKDLDPKPYYGDDNHGTSVAGVAAARGNNKIGVCGVAPEANLVGMRLIAGPQTDADIAEAMTWYPSQIPIKSNSWGYGPYTLIAEDTLTQAALEYAANYGRDGKGTVLTFAAGNYDTDEDRLDYKGINNSMYVIAVGAVDSSGHKSYYSNVGPGLAISAPSDGGTLGIMTTDRKGWYGYNANPTFSDESEFRENGDVTQTFGGTSSATPAVSGAIALMLQRNPNLGWRDVKEILMRTAVKIDADDLGWITANRSDHVTGNATVAFHFNDKYGAGLIDTAAAVALSGNWTNLKPQKSQTVTTNSTTAIGSRATVNRTFTVNGTNLRTEHATLQISVTDIPKGNLTITLQSPGNTTSTFCIPHSDTDNKFENWKFMTVRNWAESSNGTWTLSITNNGTSTGNLTNAELVVYGTDPNSTAAPPVVNLATSKTSVFVGSNFTLTATAKDKNNNSVQSLVAYQGGVSLGTSSNGTWQLQANAAGNFTFTVNATDGDGVAATSNAVEVKVLSPIAVWDFDATTYNTVPLAGAVQSTKRYAANFGTGNMTFNGNFTDSNLWSHKAGEIWVGDGTGTNAAGGMNSESLNNKALMLRGGKNIGAEGKSIVFDFSTAGLNNVNVSYASYEAGSGFGNQTWSYSTNGTTWNNIGTETPGGTYSQLDFGSITALANKTTAYLKVVFTGATAAQGVNLIDNIIISADPITAPTITANFTRLNPALARLGGMPTASPDHSAGGVSSNHSNPAVTERSENLGWVLESADEHEMTVHAEVVDGSKFLNAPGSLLSANKDSTVSGLAEPIPQTTRYELPITSAEPNPAPMRLKVYDSTSKGILVLEEKVPFTPGATIGSPTTPKRYKVAYQETEQLVSVSSGWNTFTTAVDPDPATLSGVFAGYDFSDGDRLVGPDVEATVVEGKWTPPGIELAPEVTYSLLRQSPTASQFMLKGKALDKTALTANQSPSHYGTWMNLPPGSVTTMDFVDYDTDGIDDRRQPGPGMPIPEQKSSAPIAVSAPNSAGAANVASEAAKKSKNQKRSLKIAKSSNLGKKKSDKKK